jgi:hypothetical protein
MAAPLAQATKLEHGVAVLLSVVACGVVWKFKQTKFEGLQREIYKDIKLK